jgi:hypothetical protein
MAVWALRVGFVARAVAIAGGIMTLSGSTPRIVAIGLVTWLAFAAVN